ncbi:MAG: hypothetical protein M3Y27_25545 [Acidobacteriota bacterium]|nr:hypothetical protein [Acidobacteriota bacterium]
MTFLSRVSPEFWAQYNSLPSKVQRQASKSYALFLSNPSHPSLGLKKVGPFWSSRVSSDYRVLGYRQGREFFWFWIGPHDEYERILKA